MRRVPVYLAVLSVLVAGCSSDSSGPLAVLLSSNGWPSFCPWVTQSSSALLACSTDDCARTMQPPTTQAIHTILEVLRFWRHPW